MRMRHFSRKMVHLTPQKVFWKINNIILIYLIAPFIVQIYQNFFQRIHSYARLHNFQAQNGPFVQMIISFRKAVNEPFFFHSCLSTCQKSKSDYNLLVKYWWFKNSEPLLAITWEPDFSQAFSFRGMLMSHENFHFTQFPDKTNNVIFTLFLDHLWQFLVIFARWGFFPKIPALSHITNLWAPNTILRLRKKLFGV